MFFVREDEYCRVVDLFVEWVVESIASYLFRPKSHATHVTPRRSWDRRPATDPHTQLSANGFNSISSSRKWDPTFCIEPYLRSRSWCCSLPNLHLKQRPQRGSDILARYTITTTQATRCKSCIQNLCTVNTTSSSLFCKHPPKHKHSCSQGSIVMQLTRPSQVITGTHDCPSLSTTLSLC